MSLVLQFYFFLTTLVVGCYLYEEEVMTTTNATRSAGTTASLLQPEAESEGGWSSRWSSSPDSHRRAVLFGFGPTAFCAG